jgi:hypothetical protein
MEGGLGSFCVFAEFLGHVGAFRGKLGHPFGAAILFSAPGEAAVRAAGPVIGPRGRMDLGSFRIFSNSRGRSGHDGACWGTPAPPTSGVAPSIANSSAHRTASDCDRLDRSMTPLLSADANARSKIPIYPNIYRITTEIPEDALTFTLMDTPRSRIMRALNASTAGGVP